MTVENWTKFVEFPDRQLCVDRRFIPRPEWGVALRMERRGLNKYESILMGIIDPTF